MIFSQMVLVLVVLMHLYYGLSFFFTPEPWMAKLHITSTSPAGLTEMRTFYGGLMTAMGIFFVLTAFKKAWIVPGLVMMTITFAGAVAARLYGISSDGTQSKVINSILTVEIVGLLLGIIALFLIRKTVKI